MSPMISEELLRSLDPADVVTYLGAGGWTLVDQWINGSTWQHRSNGREYIVSVPNDPSFTDYPIRVSEVVAAIAEIERRAHLDVFVGLTHASSDVIRIRVPSTNAPAGSLHIQRAERLLIATREMMTAGACAAVEFRASYGPNKPAQATRYVADRVLLGQSLPGSYVLSVLSPVGRLHSNDPPGELAPDDLFERRVTRTLFGAIAAIKAAATVALRTGDTSVFAFQVPVGVSANLCQALVDMTPGGSDQVQVAFAWAIVRPERGLEDHSFTIDAHESTVIAAAARQLASTASRPFFEVVGVIVMLEKHEGDANGTVTVTAAVDNQVRSVQARLDEVDYQIAVEAHRATRRVRLLGTLEQRGRRYHLLDVAEFGITD